MNENKDFNQDFSLSKEALERVKILLKDEEGSYFRISVLGGGCSGFQRRWN
jgi:Fe-S cluster assembly iron-binding protein IscA